MVLRKLRRNHVVRERPPGRGSDLRPLPASSIWSTIGLLLVVAAAVTWVLLVLFGSGSEQDKVRLEAIRLAGSVVLGTGGVVALFVTLRRQRATELELVHRREEAGAAQHDAEQRRVTELYTKAAEQVGHSSAAVRLAGLYALERLGQDHPEQRRPIVNLWCAYLRMPYADPEADALEDTERAWRRQEVEVRMTVQRLLRDHAHCGPAEGEPAPAEYWGDELEIDLAGAGLHDLDLAGRRVHPRTNFRGATFHGDTSFDEATLRGNANFRNARFRGSVGFHRTAYQGLAGFHGTTFHGIANFHKATFHERASFHDATFHDYAGFHGVTFHGQAWFDEATFHGVTGFRGTTFQEDARFDGATFHGDVGFRGAMFRRVGAFDGALAVCGARHAWPLGLALRPSQDTRPSGADSEPGTWGTLVPVPPGDAESAADVDSGVPGTGWGGPGAD